MLHDYMHRNGTVYVYMLSVAVRTFTIILDTDWYNKGRLSIIIY